MKGIEEINEFLFCRIKEKNEFIFKNWNRSMKQVPFYGKVMKNRTDPFFKRNINNTVIHLYLVGKRTRIHILKYRRVRVRSAVASEFQFQGYYYFYTSAFFSYITGGMGAGSIRHDRTLQALPTDYGSMRSNTCENMTRHKKVSRRLCVLYFYIARYQP